MEESAKIGNKFTDMVKKAADKTSNRELKNMIRKNVETIINFDPRVIADQVIVTSFESGIQIECTLIYLPYNIAESLQLRFDQANGIL